MYVFISCGLASERYDFFECSNEKYNKEYTKQFFDKIAARETELDKAELTELCKNVATMAKADLEKLMKQISEKLLADIAELSKLYIGESDKETMKQDMEAILAYVEKMNELNTDDIELAEQRSEETPKFREDEVREMYSVQEVLANAPKVSNGMFEVPNTLN